MAIINYRMSITNYGMPIINYGMSIINYGMELWDGWRRNNDDGDKMMIIAGWPLWDADN